MPKSLSIQGKTKTEIDSVKSRNFVEQLGGEITNQCVLMVTVMKTYK